MLRAIRFILALALLPATTLPSTPAKAGTHIVAVVGKDDGQRWNIGTQGSFCSSWKSAPGWAEMAWVLPGDTTVTPIMATWSTGNQGASNVANVDNYFMIQTTYTAADYSPDVNHVFVGFDGINDVGWGRHLEFPSDINNGKYHHIAVTVVATNNSPTIVVYLDGVSIGALSVSWSAGPLGTLANCANPLYIGAHGKNAGTIVDYSNLDVEDARIYTRALSASEISAIYKLKGRDTIRNGLVSRYSFWTDGKNTGPNGVAATAEHSAGAGSNPTITTTKVLSGTRRKVMRIDVQRLLERPANEDRQLREPHGRKAA